MNEDAARPRLLPVVLASSAVSALVTGYMLRVYVPSYNTPHTPLHGLVHGEGDPVQPARARHVVLAVMDGLSFDLAAELPALSDLRRAGVLRVLVPPFPTYTSPALVSFVTGLDPLDHGIRLNGVLTGALHLDTVTLAARDSGVATRLFSREWKPFEEVMYPTRAPATPLPLRPPPGVELISGRVRFVWSIWARAAGLAPRPAAAYRLGSASAGAADRTPGLSSLELTLAYFGEVDEAGHRHGGASPEYLKQAHHTGGLVARLAGSLDLERDAIVVVSDHGHRAAGGHGGVEPEVQRAFFLAAGAGVRRGALLDPRPSRDVAATVSLLAGVRVPTTSLGRPMLDALDLSPEQHAAALAAPFAQVGRFACMVRASPRCAELSPLATRLAAGDPAAAPLAEALLDALAADRARDDGARAAASRRLRFGAAALVTAAAFAALWARRRAALLAAARLLPLAILHASIYVATLAAFGYRPSLSAMKGENYNRDTLLASTAAFIPTVVVAILARSPPAAPWLLLAATTLPIALLAAWVGADPAVLPPPGAGAALFELAPLALSAAATAVAIRITQRWPHRFGRD